MVLVTRHSLENGKRRILYLIIFSWSVYIGGCEIWRSSHVYRPYLETFRAQTIEHERRLGMFMRTGDPHVIDSVSFPHIPGTASELISLMQDKALLSRLPSPMQRDFARDRKPAAVAMIHDGVLSFLAVTLFRFRNVILGIAVILGFLGFATARLSTSHDASSDSARAFSQW